MEEFHTSPSPSIGEVGLDDDWVDERRAIVPEKRLLAAILRRSICDYVLYKRCHRRTDERRLYADAAMEWFETDDEETPEGFYTFTFVCTELGLDPGRIRDQIYCLAKEDLKRISGLWYND